MQRKQPFIVSTGDPISGFFSVTKGPLAGYIFGLYERLLYRTCAGFVGWTPYLAGRALEMGAGRAVTVEGAVDMALFHPFSVEEKVQAKRKYGLDPSHIVCGVVGSLKWTPRQAYCYGLELIQSLKHLSRTDLSVLIVGDGNGRSRLEEMVPGSLKSRVVFTGRLPESEVVTAINALDIGYITQTLDALGSYRLTTKLPEYLACAVPVAMSPIPGYYDYATTVGWPLPALHPADPQFHIRHAAWLDRLSRSDIQAKAAAAREVAANSFDYNVVGPRFRQFIDDLLSNA